MKGYYFWGERRSIVHFLSPPQRELFHCCASCCMQLSSAWMKFLILQGNTLQIFQSGTGSTLPIFDAYRGTPSWALFVNNTQSCAAASLDNAFSCLMSASSSDLLAAMNAAMAIELFPFRPILDGPDGILSDYPAIRLSRGAGRQVPFMAGMVLDEGWFLSQLTSACSIQYRNDLHSSRLSD